MKDFLNKVLHPRGIQLFFIYLFSAVFIGLALFAVIVGYMGFLSYVAYALAAVGLTYTVYTIVIYAPGLKGRVTEAINGNTLGKMVMSDWGFRTVITAVVSFIISLGNAVLNAVAGVTSRSIWFGALAAYYIMIALLRGGLLLGSRQKVRSNALKQAKNYRNAGILLLVLNAALSSAIGQMIFDDRGFEYRDWLIYAFAAYAFYKITMAIINAFKARRQDSLTVQGIRNINIVDGAVSILSLQTALLHTFSEEGVNISLFNTLTGTAVSAFAIGLSLFMIINGNRKIKEIKNAK